MDVSTLMKLALSANSTKTISKSTDASEDQVAAVLETVLPLLLQGAATQATSKETAKSFEKAVEEHGKEDTTDLSKFLSSIDTNDGAKIVKHLLGSNEEESTKEVAKAAGVSQADVKKIMTLAAPLVLTIIGQQKKKHSNDGGSDLVKTLMTGAVTSAVTSALGGKASKTASNATADIATALLKKMLTK